MDRDCQQHIPRGREGRTTEAPQEGCNHHHYAPGAAEKKGRLKQASGGVAMDQNPIKHCLA